LLWVSFATFLQLTLTYYNRQRHWLKLYFKHKEETHIMKLCSTYDLLITTKQTISYDIWIGMRLDDEKIENNSKT
jgi:hypothetical protein